MKKVNQFQNRFSQQSVKGIQKVKKQVVLDQNFKKITYLYFKESQNLQKLKQKKDFGVRFIFKAICLESYILQGLGLRTYANFIQMETKFKMQEYFIYLIVKVNKIILQIKNANKNNKNKI